MPPEDAREPGSERSPTIEHYEAIAAASRRMLDAARVGDWDSVGHEEEHCRTLIGLLKRAQRDSSAASVARRQRLALLTAILADDAEIRELSEPWLVQLEALLAGRAGKR